MELVIKGIDRLVGQTILGKRITKIEVRDRLKGTTKCYAFTMYGNYKGKDGHKNFDSEFEVVLSKNPNPNNTYELFCMGWHGITCVYLLKEEIQDKNVFISYFEDTLSKLRKHYE